MITVKKFKKILSAVSAAVLCAMPLANGMAANAAGITKTYRVYFDVPANSGVASANYSMTYSKHMSEAFYDVGNLGGSVSSGGNGQGVNNICGCYYTANEALVNPGTLFTMKFYGDMSFEEAVIKYELTAKYSNGAEMSSNPITMDVVLVGDADGDGSITIDDAVSIIIYAANPSGYPLSNLRAADANGDGVVTEEDATMVQQYLAQIINHF